MAYLSKVPIRANHRYVARLIKTEFKSDGIAVTASNLDLICRIFARAGGKWADLFLGSSEDIGLLRAIITTAIKRHALNSHSLWR